MIGLYKARFQREILMRAPHAAVAGVRGRVRVSGHSRLFRLHLYSVDRTQRASRASRCRGAEACDLTHSLRHATNVAPANRASVPLSRGSRETP
jgi:hypothetical protein